MKVHQGVFVFNCTFQELDGKGWVCFKNGGEDSHLTLRNDEGKVCSISRVLEKLVFSFTP